MVTTRQHPEEFPPLPSTPKPEDRDSQPRAQKWAHVPPTLVTAWLTASIPFVIWDTGYCLLRPHSMPGGKWHAPWTPYALYSTIDYIYGWPAYNARNGFTSGQAMLNLMETAIYLFYLFVVWGYAKSSEKQGRKKAKKEGRDVSWFLMQKKVIEGRIGGVALLTVFSGFVMTLSKTILYWLSELFAGFDNIGHNDPWSLFWLWIVPNGLWIVFPAFASYELGSQIVQALEVANRGSGGTTKSKAT